MRGNRSSGFLPIRSSKRIQSLQTNELESLESPINAAQINQPLQKLQFNPSPELGTDLKNTATSMSPKNNLTKINIQEVVEEEENKASSKGPENDKENMVSDGQLLVSSVIDNEGTIFQQRENTSQELQKNVTMQTNGEGFEEIAKASLTQSIEMPVGQRLSLGKKNPSHILLLKPGDGGSQVMNLLTGSVEEPSSRGQLIAQPSSPSASASRNLSIVNSLSNLRKHRASVMEDLLQKTTAVNQQIKKTQTVFQWTRLTQRMDLVRRFLFKLQERSQLYSLNRRNRRHVRLIDDCVADVQVGEGGLMQDIQESRLVVRLQKLSDCVGTLPAESIYLSVVKMLMLCIFILQLFYLPLSASFSLQYGSSTGDAVIFFVIPAALQLLDMFITMNKQVYEEGVAIKSRSTIILRYLSYDFWSDLYSLIILFFQDQVSSNILQLLPFFVLQVLVRVYQLRKTYQELEEQFLIQERYYAQTSFVWLFIVILLTGHYIACGFHLVAQEETATDTNTITWLIKGGFETMGWQERYLTSLYYAFITITTIGYGDITPVTSSERLYVLIITLVGSGMFAYTINTVGQIYQEIEKRIAYLKSQKYEISMYMRTREVPQMIQHQVLKYLDYLQTLENKSPKKGHQVLSLMPKKLREEVLISFFGRVLNSQKIMALNFSTECLQDLSLVMQESLYGPGEAIFLQGDMDARLFIIIRGTIELNIQHSGSSAKQTFVERVEEKRCFGENEFFSGQQRNCQANSINVAHLAYCTRDDFINVLRSYPLDYEKFCQMADDIKLYNKRAHWYCYGCDKFGHDVQSCPLIHFTGRKEFMVQRFIYSQPQKREKHERVIKKHFPTFTCNRLVRERLKLIRSQMVQLTRLDILLKGDALAAAQQKQLAQYRLQKKKQTLEGRIRKRQVSQQVESKGSSSDDSDDNNNNNNADDDDSVEPDIHNKFNLIEDDKEFFKRSLCVKIVNGIAQADESDGSQAEDSQDSQDYYDEVEDFEGNKSIMRQDAEKHSPYAITFQYQQHGSNNSLGQQGTGRNVGQQQATTNIDDRSPKQNTPNMSDTNNHHKLELQNAASDIDTRETKNIVQVSDSSKNLRVRENQFTRRVSRLSTMVNLNRQYDYERQQFVENNNNNNSNKHLHQEEIYHPSLGNISRIQSKSKRNSIKGQEEQLTNAVLTRPNQQHLSPTQYPGQGGGAVSQARLSHTTDRGNVLALFNSKNQPAAAEKRKTHPSVPNVADHSKMNAMDALRDQYKDLMVDELFMYDFEAVREYTKYYPHGNISVLCKRQKKTIKEILQQKRQSRLSMRAVTKRSPKVTQQPTPGIDLQTGDEIAIKIETNSEIQSQLQHEAKIMKLMQGGEGFPSLVWSGQDDQSRKIMVMELLSFTLESLLQRCKKKLSLKSLLMIADQMLKRVETLHNKNYLYRDIKPENFMLGKGKGASTVYLIDFGLVKRYRDSKTGQHIEYRDNKGLIGTARFVSINTHLGIEQSRRDDLESLAYVWIYLLKGRLPWMGLQGETKEEKYERLKQKKIATPLEILCDQLPEEFKLYLSYCRQLKFEEQPDYCYLKRLFKELFFKLEYAWDCIYDWMLIKEESNFPNKPVPPGERSEEDIRGDYKKGSTTYESLKEVVAAREESAQKLELSGTKPEGATGIGERLGQTAIQHQQDIITGNLARQLFSNQPQPLVVSIHVLQNVPTVVGGSSLTQNTNTLPSAQIQQQNNSQQLQGAQNLPATGTNIAQQSLQNTNIQFVASSQAVIASIPNNQQPSSLQNDNQSQQILLLSATAQQPTALNFQIPTSLPNQQFVEKEEINFKLASPAKNNVKLKVSPQLFASIFKPSSSSSSGGGSGNAVANNLNTGISN